MSEKSVAEKLQVKPGRKVLLVNPPPEVDSLLGALPPGVTLLTTSLSKVNLWFV